LGSIARSMNVIYKDVMMLDSFTNHNKAKDEPEAYEQGLEMARKDRHTDVLVSCRKLFPNAHN